MAGKKSVSPDIVPTFDGHLFSITYSKVPFSLYVFFSNFLTSFLDSDTFSLLWRIPRISHFSGGALMDSCATTKSFATLMNLWVMFKNLGIAYKLCNFSLIHSLFFGSALHKNSSFRAHWLNKRQKLSRASGIHKIFL